MAFHAVKDGSGFQMHFETRPGWVPENVLFIHGNLASNRWWYPAESFWKKTYPNQSLNGAMFYAEFRGCGQSTAPQKEDEVQMERFADDFVSLIRNEVGGPVHLVGHSTGGLIAALMMARAPELIKKTVLLDPVGAMGVKFDNSMIEAFEKMKSDKALTALVIGSTVQNNNPDSDFFKTALVEDAYSAVKNVGHLVLKALDGLDIRQSLRGVKNPSLVLHGENDKLLSMDDSRAYTDLLPSSQFRTIPGQGHCTNIENPELFVKIVNEFLF